MNKLIIFLTGSVLLVCFTASGQQPLLTDKVNPFIGTGGHGHTYPGASMPFGMVQLSPDTRTDGWDACSGYYAADSTIYGFSHTHLSGTGCSDYGDILVMPVTGIMNLDNYGFSSSFRSTEEVASPGYYKVELDRYHIKAELTATSRTGFHRYTFPASTQAGIVFDLKHRDRVLESKLKIAGKDKIEGMRISQAWAQKQILYFVAKFSKPFDAHEIFYMSASSNEIMEVTGADIKAHFYFNTSAGEQILVKVGISAVSIEGARKNLEKEIPGWNFDEVANAAANSWNKELGKIVVSGGTHDQQVIFYTALYHALLNPNIYMDVDGKYRGRDLQIHQASGFDYYTVFSLWDTYRAAHPLYTIIDQKRTNDFINTFINQYREGGMLPVWELSGNETGCMIGYHSVPVIADAYMKGIRNYDTLGAFEAMKHSAEQDHLGLKYYKTKGYIPGDKEGESVSKTLEYAYDDWCISRIAKSLGKTGDYKTYITRAQNYKNIFDNSSGFMRAKMNETWFNPFDPSEVNFNYTEANAWQYSFYVPHDLNGLIKLMGGNDRFAQKLDALFHTDSKTTGRNQADISGMIGQYAHGNEPSHHMAYLYNYAGEPWKTQSLVHQILTTLYHNGKDGLCGNEDCGQMSSWYVLSAMGFYPVTPGSDIYVIGSPLFSKVTIHLENGRSFSITAKNISDRNFFLQSATLNGKPYEKSFIHHSDIMNGGELVFSMGDKPNKNWGTGPGNFPESAIEDNLITPIPSIAWGKRTFMDTTVVSFSSPVEGEKIFYTLDGSQPGINSALYKTPLLLTQTTTIKAFSQEAGSPGSNIMEATFFKIPKNRKITLNTQFASQYSAGGDLALVDFVRGGEDFRTGGWQGYEGVDLDAVIDLGEVQDIHSISAGFLQEQDSWIFMPLKVDFSVSMDGIDFTKAGSDINDIPDQKPGPVVKEFSCKPGSLKGRFIKVVAKNRGLCPVWHVGTGQKAWIFADEISIR
ncbi:MAG: GH92 family glycosyl hydrolase [Bacteroidetes bacterium]|nr:GH92 family glycosyl hydrolase [Bacteroidota bacterium]